MIHKSTLVSVGCICCPEGSWTRTQTPFKYIEGRALRVCDATTRGNGICTPKSVMWLIMTPKTHHPKIQKKKAQSNDGGRHGDFDAVLFTDVSSASDTWHRASAGIPDSFRSQLPAKVRIPLFSCMIALSSPIRHDLPFDAFTANDNDALWFASVSQSKPGIAESCQAECWTLISTPSFAVGEIQETTMRDPVTGAFRPQENGYLNSVPGPTLAQAFFDVIMPHLSGCVPDIEYLQAQRWGSGLSVPESIGRTIVDVCGTRYAADLLDPSLVFARPEATGNEARDQDYVADDELGLYYAGDFCSHRNPGFEAAALSGLEAARHLAALQQCK